MMRKITKAVVELQKNLFDMKRKLNELPFEIKKKQARVLSLDILESLGITQEYMVVLFSTLRTISKDDIEDQSSLNNIIEQHQRNIGMIQGVHDILRNVERHISEEEKDKPDEKGLN